MPLEFVRNDITKMKVDAIVNAANSSLLGGGGVDGAIHRAAGPELLAECRTLGGCKPGCAKVTKGYNLPCKYVIHTVGPVWRGGLLGEKRLLSSCYRKSLELAKSYGCESVAFPLISSGAYGYPKEKAIRVAVNAIADFLRKNEMHVYLVIFDRDTLRISEKLFGAVQTYIDDNYIEIHASTSRRTTWPGFDKQTISTPWNDDELIGAPDESFENWDDHWGRETPKPTSTWDDELIGAPEVRDDGIPDMVSMPRPYGGHRSLEEDLEYLDESFTEMLFRKIDEKGLKDSQVYKKANIDRKLFSKIRSNEDYRPSKPTVLALAVALELPLEETKDMLCKAGFALSHSTKFDVIMEYFIRERRYNIFEINEVLFYYDQNLLGGKG